jgi:lipoyl(octanoyl) transferase
MNIEILDWGLIDYEEAWEKQKEIVSEIQKNRDRNVFILCEHPAVITIGRAGSAGNIIIKDSFLNQMGIKVIYSDRGGDVTLHNPGQLVGYPIFNLSVFKQDLHWFLREIEAVLIDTIAEFGVIGGRVDGLTGVWVEGERKIAAMGLHCSRWVTSHGFALNVDNSIEQFSYIVPCGIKDKNKTVTSVKAETGKDISIVDLKSINIEKMKKRFNNFKNI